MFGWLKRLFRIGKAEANAVLDKLEDPSKMMDQEIKNLKKDLEKSLQGLAEIKSLYIKSKKQLNSDHQKASDYEMKAIQLLKKAEEGTITPEQADSLAQKALQEKGRMDERVIQGEKDTAQYEKLQSEMQGKVNQLKSMIQKYESEVKIVKARSRASKATLKVNELASGVDSNGTIARLERMKEKVDQQEALAEAYGEMGDDNKSVDDEINSALGDSGNTDALEKLKAKMSSQKQIEGDSSSSTPSKDSSSDQPLSELEKLKSKLKG